MAYQGADLVGRSDELADIGIALAELASGRPRPRAYVGDPGLGKTSMLGALVVTAQVAGRPTRWLRADQPTAMDEVAAAPPGGVVVVDDLHRLPAGAVPTLERLLASATGSTLVAVGYRPRQAAPETMAALHRSPLLQLRPLAPLSLIDAGQILGELPDLAELHLRAEGNPLYLRQLADRTPGHDAALRAELAELSAAQLSLAQAAAVIRDSVTAATLFDVASVDESDAATDLDALLAADVLRVVGLGPLLVFRHEAVAAVAYRTMTIGRRAELHRRADRELERRGAPARDRARHLVHAVDVTDRERRSTLARGAQEALSTNPSVAVEWLEAAVARLGPADPCWAVTKLLLGRAQLHLGRLTESRATLLAVAAGTASPDTNGLSPATAPAEAVVYAGQVERLLGRYPEGAALVRSGLGGDALPGRTRVLALVELSEVAAEANNSDEAEQYGVAAVDLARSLGDPASEALALGELAWSRTCLGDVTGGGAAIARAAGLLDALPDVVAVHDVDGLRRLGHAEMLIDRLIDARRHIGRGLRLSRQSGQRHVEPTFVRVLGETELRLGRLRRAHGLLTEAESLGPDDGPAYHRTLTVTGQARTLLWLHASARVDESVATAERAVHLADDHSAEHAWTRLAHCGLAEALVLAGDPGRARRILLGVGGAGLSRVEPFRRIRWYELLVAASVLDGEIEAAEAHLAQLLAAAERMPTHGRIGTAHRARARLARARGDIDAAVAAGDAAAEAFLAAAMLLDAGISHVIAAGAAIDGGRRDGVQHRLDLALELADRCGSGRLAEDVRREMERPSARLRTWLTEREFDVAMLAGQALASPEIAARLHLSVRTVDSHLGRIYRKLGVANRVALANLVNNRPEHAS